MDAKHLKGVTRASCSSRNCSVGSQIETLKPLLEVDIWQSALTTLHDAAALSAVLLNCITLLVLHRANKLELRDYLVHLAVADLMFSFKQVFVYLNFKVVQPFPCPAWAFSVGLALFVSMFIMVAIAVSRYYALLQPTRRFVRGWLTKNRIIVSIWLLGIIFCSPLILIYSWDSGFKNIGLYYYCDPVGKGFLGYYQGISVFIITFLVPFMLLSFLFWKIKYYLSRYQVPGTANVTRDRAIRQVHVEASLKLQIGKVRHRDRPLTFLPSPNCLKFRQAVNMLAVVVALFAALWLPPQIFMVLHEICEKYISSLSESSHIRLHLAFNLMTQVHSCVNPIIYSFMSMKFREELIHLMPWLSRFPCFAKLKKTNSKRLNNLLHANNQGVTVSRAIELRSLSGEECRIQVARQMSADLI